MDRVVAPILRTDRGPAVHNLQDVLVQLLARTDSPLPERERAELARALITEQREDRYGDATTRAVAQFQRDHQAAFDIPLVSGVQVDEPTAAAMNLMLEQLGRPIAAPADVPSVGGRVEFEDETPAPGLRVAAFDRDLGARRVPLGDPATMTITGDDGTFAAIQYRAGDVSAGEGRAGPDADIVFEISDPRDGALRAIASLHHRVTVDGTSREEASDPILGFEATHAAVVRVVLTGRPRQEDATEYARVTRDLQPLLLDRATPASLDQERFRDIDFAARETGSDRELIGALVIAWHLAGEAQRLVTRDDERPRDDLGELPETFYGLLRPVPSDGVMPLPGVLDELLEQDALWTAKLADSLDRRFIGGELPQHLARLRALRTEHAVRPGDGRVGSVGDVLTLAGVSGDGTRALLAAWNAHEGSLEEFWRDVIPRQGAMSAEQVRAVQDSL